MGLLDRFKKNKLVEKALDNPIADKAGDIVGTVGEKVAEGVDKATDMVDSATGGKMTGALDKIDDMADKLAGDAEEAVDEATGGEEE